MSGLKGDINWSKFADQYTLPSGRTFIWPMLLSCMEQHFLPIMDGVVAAAKDSTQQPIRVLILAGGPGPEVPLLLNRYGRNALSILLTDYSPAMVEKAKTNMANADVQDIVETRLMDATNIDEPDASFDIVFICYGIFAIDEYEKCFQEVGRVLKPGGYVFLSTPGALNVPLQLFSEEKRKWLAENYNEHHPVFVANKKRLTDIVNAPWRNVDIVRERLQACQEFDDDMSVIKVPCMWSSPEDKDVNELYDCLFHYPMVNMAFLDDFASDDERGAFFRLVRQRALVVAKAEGGLATESNSAWARKAA